MINHFRQGIIYVGLLLPLTMTSGCGFLPPAPGQTVPEQRGRPDQANEPVAVKSARAKAGSVNGLLTYTGSTRPQQQVTLRSQVSGEVIALSVDVGDKITRGDVLAQLDGDLQTANFNEAQAELSARRAETAQAEVSIRDAQSAVVRAQATLDQAQIDATRLRQLAMQGAISQQTAEAAELAVTNAEQAVRSAQSQVDAQRQAAAAAAERINSQQAILAQTQRQLSYADLISPLTGVVLSRQVEVGDFVESGDTVLELGDLSKLDVTIQVSELEIGQLSVGQPAQVQLDAFPDEGSITGQIERIAPVADSISRLVPVQVSIPNRDGGVVSGLLSRVQFPAGQQTRVVVPASALTLGEELGEGDDVVFVIEGEGDQAEAIARSVRIGAQGQDRVEILSGLTIGELFVAESERPLASGQAVRLSILSE